MGEDAANGAGTDSVAEADEFALDAAVSPPGIGSRDSYDQGAEFVADRWPAGAARVGPVLAYEAPVPGQQGRGGDDPPLAENAGVVG